MTKGTAARPGASNAARTRGMLLCGAAALFVGGVAQAQDTPAGAQQPPVAQNGLPTTTSTADPAGPDQLTRETTVNQDSAAPPSQSGADVVVTGSRITSSGFTAPTPTQVIGAEQIARNAQSNIFTTIAQLPSLQGSTGASTGTNSTSSGTQGLSSFSLRGLGTIRTLTLLDGQRVVGANVTGVPDVSLFPQLLVKRVDVVTGGASASYGSDAVGGVVNFITDKRFEGIKANAQFGISDYGDDETALFQVAWGKSFANDRLHLILSGEYDSEAGVPAGSFGEDAPGRRDWYRTTTLLNRGITNDGAPQYLYRDHAQAYQYTKYGLISAGPLQGTAFDVNGNPFPFQYGSNGVPSRNASGTVSGCYTSGGFCVGGDLSGNVGIGTSLKSSLERMNGYGRVGFDLDADNEIYAAVNIAKVNSSNQPNPGAAKSGLTIQCSNPFVPLSVQQACAANNITQFQYGLSNAILPNIKVSPSRKQYRFVGGATGKLPFVGGDWRYDVYYEHGENITDIHVDNITLTPRYNAAIQAIRLNGDIVCANPIARANGCVPINIFGGNTPSDAALAYLEPENGPFQHTRQTQDVISANISGEPFALWAGPVSIATGVEWRREFYRVTGDPYGNGLDFGSQYDANYPADPLLSTNGNNWYAGNYQSGTGRYNVLESFLETNIPLLNSDALGRANLNAAGRATRYSTSGTVYTWKVGGTWDTPLDGLRLRAVTSRDVRAPNLSELFAAPISVNVPNFTNPFTNGSVNIFQNTIGNPDLKPERARNTELGIVFARPKWLPGFSVSFDYYDIKIDGVIAALSAQQVVNLCFSGVTATCGAFDLSGTSQQPFVNVQSFNLASIKTSGFDIEASYQMTRPLGLPGNLTLRGLGTNVRKFTTDTGLPRTTPIDAAGANSGATPDWKWLAIETWDGGDWTLLLQQRWFSDGVIGHQYVECSAGNCPVSTVNNPTIDRNFMAGAFYFDVGGSVNLANKLTAYFKVDNLFNRDPEPSPQTNTGVDINPALYDTIGRFYRVGLRYNF
ncbi:TonB-dependent Receptor Plug Domain [Sphingomonas gellani]|uniref:TonB-dependent Receptor Plug Domain n=1 Tax=Sphingomonas gellani TaxID=1166340 RepID=A0A1H8GLC1_9SPHN|nr:TonB-dependent receptor [Sphingomonas gellani]SEN44610.1 TonB-dependent Receptor Plug Domain [Sphingomonas gellani]